MKRFLIFTVLYPPLVLLGLIATVSEIQRNLDIGELHWMLGIAYLVGLIPAWLSATTDWALSAKPIYYRVLGTAVVGAAAVMAAITALQFGEMLRGATFVMIALISGIPAAVCSWLSNRQNRGTQ